MALPIIPAITKWAAKVSWRAWWSLKKVAPWTVPVVSTWALIWKWVLSYTKYVAWFLLYLRSSFFKYIFFIIVLSVVLTYTTTIIAFVLYHINSWIALTFWRFVSIHTINIIYYSFIWLLILFIFKVLLQRVDKT